MKIALLGSALGVATFATEQEPKPPWKSNAVDLETGLLWEIGTGTPIPYRLVPTQLSWRSQEIIGRDLPGGARILFRHRFTLLGTWVQNGPESHYVAVTGSLSLELWNKPGTWSMFAGSGGGAGLLNSRGVKGGQGQDFTLTWFIRGGIEHVVSRRTHLSAGIMYEHMSNGGQTKPNPGIDALGFTLGYTWAY